MLREELELLLKLEQFQTSLSHALGERPPLLLIALEDGASKLDPIEISPRVWLVWRHVPFHEDPSPAETRVERQELVHVIVESEAPQNVLILL